VGAHHLVTLNSALSQVDQADFTTSNLKVKVTQMSVQAFSSSIPAYVSLSSPTTAKTGQGTQPAPHAVETQPQHDTVKLTGTALAKSLKLAGQNPAQIALKLGLDLKTVDSYLNIKVAANKLPPAVPAPTTTPVTAVITMPFS
jgi:hypothetical protein